MIAHAQLTEATRVNRALAVDPAALEEICRKYCVRRLVLFGSALRDDFSPQSSDLDFVVEFDRRLELPWDGQVTGLMNELSELFGRDVDVVERLLMTNRFLQREVDLSGLTIYGEEAPARETGGPSMTEREHKANRTRGVLSDILESCKAILGFCADVEKESFCSDPLLQAAVERHLITIGEAAGSLRKANPEAEQRITALKEIVAMRNRLVHQYQHTDPQVVWDVVHKHLPILRDEVQGFLGELAE